MRIAVLHPSFAIFGGTEKLITDLYPALVARGHEVTLFTTALSPALAAEALPGVTVVDIGPIAPYGDDAMFDDEIRVGRTLADKLLPFDVVRMHGVPSPVWWLRACETLPELRKKTSNWCCGGIMNGPYDYAAAAHIIATQRMSTSRTKATWDLIYRRLKHVRENGCAWAIRRAWQSISGWRRRYNKELVRIDREAVANVTRVVTDSRFVADYLRRIWDVEPTVCHPGIRASADANITPPGNEMLSVCRLQGSKNIETVIRAIELLRRTTGKLPFSRYVIAGDGPERAALARLARQLGVDDAISFEGTIANRELAGHYVRAALFVLPALDEGFGVTFLEAALNARASIAPDHGGPSEIVVDGETGWLIDPMDVHALADAIVDAFANPGELQSRGVRARERALTVFSMDRFVRCTENACLAAEERR